MNGEVENKGIDERFARDAERLLHRSAEQLDVATMERLKRARQNALAAYGRGIKGPFRLGLRWQPALGAAAVCATALIAVGLWMGQATRAPSPGATPVPVSAGAGSAADLEVVLVDDDNLEMIEDLEFYDWLESAPAMKETADPGVSG